MSKPGIGVSAGRGSSEVKLVCSLRIFTRVCSDEEYWRMHTSPTCNLLTKKLWYERMFGMFLKNFEK